MKLSFTGKPSKVLHPASIKGQINVAVAFLSIKTEDVQMKTNEAFVKHVCTQNNLFVGLSLPAEQQYIDGLMDQLTGG